MEKYYETYLVSNGKKHSEVVFLEFFGEKEGCPDRGIMNYEEGKVCCNIHREEETTIKRFLIV